jgi:hypothetical protein
MSDVKTEEGKIEFIARALCRADIDRDTEEQLARAVDTLWPHYAADARTALERLSRAKVGA